MNWFLIKRYLFYILKPNHRKGFGIHSPFIFDFVGNLMQEKHAYYDFDRIRAWRRSLINSKELIPVTDLGAGSKIRNTNNRKVSSIVQHGAIPEKYGELLFRMVCRFKPDKILELGTSAGLSTLYLALPKKRSQVITIEGCPETAKLAQHTFGQFNANQIQLLNGSFKSELPKALNALGKLDMIYIDGDHKEASTIEYFNECLKYAHNNSIFVFDDIHWSKGMENAWHTIISHPAVTVSLDLFRIGIVFFRKENTKEHFVVRY